MRRLGPWSAVGFVFSLFAAAFALHVVAGAAGLQWLFLAAVAVIYVTAAGLPALALLLARSRPPRPWWGVTGMLALVLTGGAVWAAAGRQVHWWLPPATVALVLATSAAIAALASGARQLAQTKGWSSNSSPPVR